MNKKKLDVKRLTIMIVLWIALTLLFYSCDKALATNVPYDPNTPSHNNIIGTMNVELGEVVDRYLNCYDVNGTYDTNFLLIDMVNQPPNSTVGESVEIAQPHDHKGTECTRNPCLWYHAYWSWTPDEIGNYRLLITCEDSATNNDFGILEVNVECNLYEEDLNNDCDVDIQDIQLMAEHWLELNPTVADINKDNKVDYLDFVLISKNWLKVQQ